jgi:hypothetical protein
MLRGMQLDTKDHPALELSEPRRVEYLSVVASLVLADGEVHRLEMDTLHALCRGLRLSQDAEAAVLEAVRPVERGALEARLDRIRGDAALRYALMTDAIVLVMVDGRVAVPEAQEIAAIGQALHIPTPQIVLIGRYVESVVLASIADTQADLPLSRALSDALSDAGTRSLPSQGWVSWLYHLSHRRGAGD